MTTWLETETRALLQRCPPEKLAPATTGEFTLVLIAFQPRERARLARTVQRACGRSEVDAWRILARSLPLELRRGLTYADAMIGHYELIACDAAALILPDGVVLDSPPGYLEDLYAFFRKIPEFQLVSVHVEFLPHTEEAREFIDHFLGGGGRAALFARREVLRKKAQWMMRLAAKIGGRMRIYETK